MFRTPRFAQWADVVEPGPIVGSLAYQESEAYHIWAGNTFHDVTVKSGGESYGIDINQGYFALQYGIAPRWAVDLSIGATTVGGVISPTAPRAGRSEPPPA